MIKNNLKIALGIVWRNKAFIMLNVMGLLLGFALSILVLHWVELT